MESVTVRELRNSGGEVLRRVERGERVVVTRDDPDALRRDIDNLIDPSV